MERDDIVAEQPVEQALADVGWQHPPRVGSWPRDVHEVGENHVGAALPDQVGHQVEVVVVQHHNRTTAALLDFVNDRIGERFVDAYVAVLERVTLQLPDVRRVAQVVQPVLDEPQQGVGDHGVEVLVGNGIDLDQTDLKAALGVRLGDRRFLRHRDVQRSVLVFAGHRDVFVGARRAYPHRVVELGGQAHQRRHESARATTRQALTALFVERDRRPMGEHDDRHPQIPELARVDRVAVSGALVLYFRHGSLPTLGHRRLACRPVKCPGRECLTQVAGSIHAARTGLPRAWHDAGFCVFARLARLVPPRKDGGGGARRPGRLRAALRRRCKAGRAAVRTESTPTFDVVERIAEHEQQGGKAFSHVDFGAIGTAAARDSEPLTAAQAKRSRPFSKPRGPTSTRSSRPRLTQLRKGPRGGGRDRDGVFDHVIGAETAYARKLGVRHKAPHDREGIEAVRAGIIEAISGARAGEPAIDKGWLPRFAARRIAWHVLDHAWEIEDRS